MIWQRRSRQLDSSVSMLWCLMLPLLGAIGIFGSLHALMQPVQNPNPGLAAYRPPPGTRIEPLPVDMTSPPRVELSGSYALQHVVVEEKVPDKPPEVVKVRTTKLEARKKPRARPRRQYYDHWSDYAQNR